MLLQRGFFVAWQSERRAFSLKGGQKELSITAPQTYEFRPVTEADFPLIADWRKRPHVLKWWGDDEQLTKRSLLEPLVQRWIVSLNDRPFAYIQDYAVRGWEFEHYFEHLPKGARGIDQYIGEPDMTAQGHGSAFISQHVRVLFSAGVPVVATDPDPDNAIAVAVYKKVGFKVFGDVINSDWGPVLPMKIDAMGTNL